MKTICKDCKEFKKHHAKGLCRNCYQKQWVKNNSEKTKAYKKKWFKANSKKVNAKNRKYRFENKEKIRAVLKKYRLENKEKRKEYRFKNKEEIKAIEKKYRLENPGKIREFSLKRRGYGKAKKGTIDRVINENIFKYGVITCEKDKKPCPDNFHIDHIIPVSKGGINNYDNLQILCAHCNLVKHTDIVNYLEDNKNNQMFLKAAGESK